MEIKRDIYLNKLIARKHNGLIKIVTGLRRSGKSYLLFDLFKNHLLNEGTHADHIIMIALDNYEQEEYRDPDVCFHFVKVSQQLKAVGTLVMMMIIISS